MQKFLFFLFIFLAVLFVGTVTTFPLVLLLLLIFYILKRDLWIFFAAFIAGIFLDVISVKTLGESSIFFILFLLVIALYEGKFEIQTLPFVAIASFLGSLIYLFLFGYNFVLQQAIASAVLSAIFFKIIMRISKKKASNLLQ